MSDRSSAPRPAGGRQLLPAALHRASRRVSYRFLLLFIVGLGLLWRVVRYGLGFPFWGDESFVGVNFITRDFAGMIRPLDFGQIVPLFYMWANLALTKVLGVNEWSLRLVAVVSGIAALLLFARLAFRTQPRVAALLATAFLAAGYYVVRHGAELKPYASDLLVAVALYSLAWRVWQRPDSAGRWGWLAAMAAIAPWCSLPSVFVGGSAGLLLTWRMVQGWRGEGPGAAACAAAPAGERAARHCAQRRTATLGWLVLAAVLVGGFLWMHTVYAAPHARAAERLTEINMWAKTFPPLSEPWKLPLWFVAMHTGLMFAYPHGGTAPGSLITFALFLVGAVRLWQVNRGLLLLLLLPFALTFVAAAFEKYPYGGSVRTSMYLAPAICLLAGRGAAELLRLLGAEDRRVAVQTVIWVLAVLPIAGIISDIRQPYADDSVRRSYLAVRSVAEQTRPGDLWITFNAVEPCDYAPWLGDWQGTGGQFVFDALRMAPVPLRWAPRPEEVPAAGGSPGGRVFLLSYSGVKVDFPLAQFDAYLAALRARLGEPHKERHPIKSRDGREEALEVYRFGG